MLFTKDAARGLADGSITLTFRNWSKPQARAGGRYRTCGLLLEVDSIQRIRPDAITDADARRAGSVSAADLRRKLAKLDNQDKDGVVWRIEFHCVGADDRIARRNDATLDRDKFASIESRLVRLDKASGTGAWTHKTLQLIASHPGVVSTLLAKRMKMDRPEFKLNVRKLKELGLTESLDVGYRLSPLGEAFTARTKRV